MSLAPITEEQRQFIYKSLNTDEHIINSKLIQMKEWLIKQPHMPKIPENVVDKILIRFLMGTKMNTETAKQKLDSFYEFRHRIPEIMFNRDPLLPPIRDYTTRMRMTLLHDLTPECVRVCVVQLRVPDGQKITNDDMISCVKQVYSGFYIRITELEECCTGDFIVVDFKGFQVSYVTEIRWPLLMKGLVYLQEAVPVSVKGIFVLNVPSFFQTVANMVKAVLKDKMRNRFHVTSGDHTELYKYIPQAILPADYGGNAPSMDELTKEWAEMIESHRDVILEEEKLVTDESRRPPGSNRRVDTFGVQGTFTSLNID